MENCEQPIVERYEKLHAEYSSLIQKTKQDFQSEAFSENLTDIYLFQHQTNTGLVNMIKQMKLPEKIEILTNKGEQALKQFQELKGAYENKEKSSKGNLESILKELNEQHNKHIEQMEAQKKEIDNDFKEKLKSLSKNYS